MINKYYQKTKKSFKKKHKTDMKIFLKKKKKKHQCHCDLFMKKKNKRKLSK